MKYIQVQFAVKDEDELTQDILSGLLSTIGYEAFYEDDDTFNAFIPIDDFNWHTLRERLLDYPNGESPVYIFFETQERDWNKEWEENYFNPIVIGNEVVVHATFHKDYPKAKYDIVIEPQMSFGTGHHQTTRLMMEYILNEDLTGKHVLDMGCGTGILAILATLNGAAKVDAIDIDEWCVNNTTENISLNHCENITVSQGDAKLLTAQTYDVILANINRNILVQDMERYAAALRGNGILVVSGFFLSDLDCIAQKAKEFHLRKVSQKMLDGTDVWCAALFMKA